MCVLTTLLTNEVQLIQVLNSCNTTLLLLLDEFLESQKTLEDAVRERNRPLRRYIRRSERYIIRRPRLHWKNPGRTDSFWDNLVNDRTPSSEWRKKLRMDKEIFMELVQLLAPILNPDPKTFI